MHILRFGLIIAVAFFSAQCSEPETIVGPTALLPMDAPLVVRINNMEKFSRISDSTSLTYFKAIPDERLTLWNKGNWTGAIVASGAQKFDWVWTTEMEFMSDAAELTVLELDSFSAIRSGNHWAFSKTPALLQDVINQLRAGYTLGSNPEFSKLWDNASGGDAMNLFLQHSEIKDLGTHFFDQDWSWLSQFSSWSEIDIAWRKDKIIATTVALCSDSSNTYLSTFQERATGTKLSPVIAASAKYAIGVNTGDPTEWLRNFNFFRGKKQRLKQAQKTLEESGINAMTFANGFEGSFVRMGYGDGIVMAARLGDSDILTNSLEKLSDNLGVHQGHTRGTLKDGNRFLFSAAFGWLFSDLGAVSWMVWDQWLLLSHEAALLEVYSSELDMKKTWDGLDSMEPLAKAMDRSEHFTIALNFNSFDESVFFPELPEHLQRAFLTAHLEVNQGIAYGNATVQERGEEVTVSSYLWSHPLNQPAISGPFLVKNHRTGMNNVFVQDESNTAYLLDESGQELWTITLDGPIQGAVNQIDLFKNDKYQLVFATKESLHCLDVLGREVDGYPVALKGTSDLGATVLDYDKNRNYRILVPVGSKLYNYGTDGKLVDGWEVNAASSTITQSPILYQIGGKDYIITSTLEKAHALNRRGENRVKTATLTASKNPWSPVSGTPPSLLRVGEVGELQEQRLDGTSRIVDHDMSNLKGMATQPYGLIYWTNDEVILRSETGSTSIEFPETIVAVDTYPGGTGIIYDSNGTIHITYLLDPTAPISTFEGSAAKAGRLTPSGAPVLVLTQGNAVICYQL